MKHNMVGWFEIPVTNMERAKDFYETVFKVAIKIVDFGGLEMGWFPDRGNVIGAQGTLIKQDICAKSRRDIGLFYL